jgi:hypothetical protein
MNDMNGSGIPWTFYWLGVWNGRVIKSHQESSPWLLKIFSASFRRYCSLNSWLLSS